MDRSDDVTRSRRFTAQSLGSQQNRPRIVTARDERVAVWAANNAIVHDLFDD